jgi:hypothetical protein
MRLYDLVRQLLADGITVDVKIQVYRTQAPGAHGAKCQYCGWESTYSTRDSANRALRAHYQHCSEYAQHVQWIAPAGGDESQEA